MDSIMRVRGLNSSLALPIVRMVTVGKFLPLKNREGWMKLFQRFLPELTFFDSVVLDVFS